MRLPESPVIIVAVLWLIFVTLILLVWGLFAPTNVAEATGSFVINLFLSAISGGLSADFGPLQWLSWIAVLTFLATQLISRCQSHQVAQISFAAFMLLSMLTFWVDSLLVLASNSLFSFAAAGAAAEGLAEEVASKMTLRLPLPVQFVIHMILHGSWVFAWVLVARELQSEGREQRLRGEHQQKVEALLHDAFAPTGPVEPPVLAVKIVAIPCTVCQHMLPSNTRFCSRCGAPVNPVAAPQRDSE